MLKAEVVKRCPHCATKNVYPDKDCERDGYIETCKTCGEEIMLCDECMHAKDNFYGRCDWKEVIGRKRKIGVCFRGATMHSKKRKKCRQNADHEGTAKSAEGRQ